MRKIVSKIALFACVLASATAWGSPSNTPAPGPEPGINILKKMANSEKTVVDTTQNIDFLDEMVIVGNDTVSIILPQKNYGRFDRGLFNFMFIPKGQWDIGLTTSYGQFTTEDIEILSILSDIDLEIKGYAIKPSVAYFFRHNQSLGVRFNYTNIYGAINSLNLDIDDDMNFNLTGVSYNSNNYSVAFFYRNYLGLGRNGRFGLFNEVALNLGGGKSTFTRNYAGMPKVTDTNTFSASLEFSPGLCVFIQDYISFNVSFGVFGLRYKHEKQMTDGQFEGERNSSGANFRFNLFNINFGIAAHF